MNIFDGKYFNLNKIFLTCIGFRPYSSTSNKVIQIVIIIFSILMMVPHGISAIMYYRNIDRLMLSLVCVLALSIVSIKLVTLSVSQKNFEELYDSMTTNFQMIRDEEERKILIQYSERGRMLTIGYTITLSISGMMMCILPCLPGFLDIVYPLEEPRASIHLTEGEYFFDRDVHPFLMFCCETSAIVLVVLCALAVDPMYMASAEHACALYAIISFRLRNLNSKMQGDKLLKNFDDLYEQLCITVQLHRESLRFTSIMNDSYSKTFLFIMFVSIGLIPLNACAIIANLHSMLSYLPYALMFNGVMIHLFMVFFPGQRILDHGTDLFFDAYCNDWYALPHRVKKLLLIFMLRCTQPALLAGGGLFLIVLETYVKIVKTSLSYIAVLSSFRNQ